MSRRTNDQRPGRRVVPRRRSLAAGQGSGGLRGCRGKPRQTGAMLRRVAAPPDPRGQRTAASAASRIRARRSRAPWRPLNPGCGGDLGTRCRQSRTGAHSSSRPIQAANGPDLARSDCQTARESDPGTACAAATGRRGHSPRHGGPLGSRSGDVGGPVGHQHAAPVEQVAAPVGGFDAIAVDVRQGELAHLARRVRAFRRPVRGSSTGSRAARRPPAARA